MEAVDLANPAVRRNNCQTQHAAGEKKGLGGKRDRTEDMAMAREYKDVSWGWTSAQPRSYRGRRSLPNGELKLAGLGMAPSNGLKRGVVVNIDATVQSISRPQRAELMADCKIARVYTGITGSHIRGSTPAAWWP